MVLRVLLEENLVDQLLASIILLMEMQMLPRYLMLLQNRQWLQLEELWVQLLSKSKDQDQVVQDLVDQDQVVQDQVDQSQVDQNQVMPSDVRDHQKDLKFLRRVCQIF